MEMIRAVFVTHDHADHIKAVGGLCEKLNIPIYTCLLYTSCINMSMGMYFTAVTGLLNTTWLHKVFTPQ